MKTIGLLGGMSWESSLGYYQAINQDIKQKLGGLHSAKIILNSVDFAEIELLQRQGDWTGTATILIAAAKAIESAGADFLLICTNTMHIIAPEIASNINIPLLHIADATAEQLKIHSVNKVGLLGTSFTMEESFYKGRLVDKHEIEVIVPNQNDRKIIHNIIYQQLCLGIITVAAKQEYLRIIDDLSSQGVQAVILGCTEIGLLINQKDTNTLLFDTTLIHAKKAVTYALDQDN